MDYITRQFINLTKKFRKESRKVLETLQREIKKHTESIRETNERNHQQDKIWQERFNEILSEHQQAEKNKTTSDNRHYRVQNSIRWATWFAVLAATIYAGITALQLFQMRNANRPWIGMSDHLTIKGSPSLSFTDLSPLLGEKGKQTRMLSIKFLVSGAIKNFGNSPARREYSTFEAVSFGDILAEFREEDCARAERVSRGKYSADSFVSPDHISIDRPARVIFPTVELPVEEGMDFLVELSSPPYLLAPSLAPLDDSIKPPPKWTDKIPRRMWIVGCIAYQDTANQMHHTKVFYQSSLIGEMPKIAEDANPSDVHLVFGDFIMEDSESD